MIWVVAEEAEERYTTARVQALAAIIRDADDHGHPIGSHHLSGTTFKSWQPGGTLNHFSMQLTSSGEAAHTGAIMALRQAAGRYQVVYAESTAIPKDPDGMRRFAWDVAMGGVMPMIYSMDIAHTPPATLSQCRYLQRFFESTDFTTLAPHDEYRWADTRYVLADPGRSYIAYSERAGEELGLRALPAGNCAVTWLDCQTGASLTEQHRVTAPGDRVFRKPSSLGPEVAAWIRFPEIPPAPRHRSAGPVAARPATHLNQPPIVIDFRIRTPRETPAYVQLTISDDDGPGPYTYTIVEGPRDGVLTGRGNDRTYTPRAGFVGSDGFTWKAHDGADSSPTVTVSIRVNPPAASGTPPPKQPGKTGN